MKCLICLLLASCATAGSFASGEPSFGPRVNPDDQYRFFWHIGEEVLFPYGVDMGLNLIYDPYVSRWYHWTKEEQDADTARRRRFFRRMETNGIDVIEFVTADGRVNRPEFGKLQDDGKRNEHALDLYLPGARDLLRRRWEATAEAMKGLPNLVGINAVSEPYYGNPSRGAEFVAACEKALGYPPPSKEFPADKAYGAIRRPDFPISGVVRADYRPLEYFTWYWRRGTGWNGYNEDCSAVYDRVFGRHLPRAYDPVTRCPPLWGSGGRGLSVGNQWFYPVPQPYGASFMVSEEKAMARGTPGMEVFTMLQGMCYHSVIAPRDKTPTNVPAWAKDRPNAIYPTMPPDIMREALWTLFSRQIAGVGFHGAPAIFDICLVRETEEEKAKERQRAGYQHTTDETRLAIRDAFRRAGIPLGPLLKAVPERSPEVALLQCYSTTLLTGGGCTFGWGSPYGDLLVGANMTPYVLYEEEIVRDGLPPTLKVIVAADCPVMLDTTRDALLAFQKRGGVIVATPNLAPGVLADMDMPEGLMSRHRRMERAAEDTVILKRLIPQLKRDLAPYVTPYADSENGDLVVHARTYGAADYVFAVNDRRTFGDYVGPWGVIQEKGLPNAGVVTVARTDTKAVYDLVEHRAVPFRVKDGRTEIDVSYTTTDGRIFLVSPRPLAALTIRREGDEVVVRSSDKDVMIPIRIEADGQKPRTGVVADGVWRRTYPHGANLRVTNFADGRVVRAEHGVPFKIGIAGYTFNKLGLEKGVETMRAIDCHALCHKDFFLGYDASDAEIAAFKEQMATSGVEVLATGPLYSSDAKEIRRQFEFAKKLGVRVLVGVPYALGPGKKELDEDSVESDGLLDVVDGLVKEFDMVYAIHNHGPDMTNLYPTAESVLKRIGNRDRRIGVCLDVGHEQRAGRDPAAFIRAHADRIYDVHLKNIIVDPKKNRAMPGPRGELDVFGIFQALADIGYTGVCHIEYERDKENNAMGLAESFGYYRGVAQGVVLR